MPLSSAMWRLVLQDARLGLVNVGSKMSTAKEIKKCHKTRGVFDYLNITFNEINCSAILVQPMSTDCLEIAGRTNHDVMHYVRTTQFKMSIPNLFQYPYK